MGSDSPAKTQSLEASDASGDEGIVSFDDSPPEASLIDSSLPPPSADVALLKQAVDYPRMPYSQSGPLLNEQALTTARQALDEQFGAPPIIGGVGDDQSLTVLQFGRTQEIQQRPGETSDALHERLRPLVTAGMEAVRGDTQIDTPSWYTFDASKVLGIENAVVISTSTCKHETPSLMFVGVREPGWQAKLGEDKFRYQLRDLGRELTQEEKNAIYNLM